MRLCFSSHRHNWLGYVSGDAIAMRELSDLLNDEAIYRRTATVQRELTDRFGRLSGIERRFLSAVTGHTPLRVLLDLGIDGPGIS